MRRAVLAAAAVLAVLPALVSCQEKTELNLPSCPSYDVGALEGRVLAGGEPAVAWVSARGTGESPFNPRFVVLSDSSGRYRLDLPSGEYTIDADPVNAPPGNHSPAEVPGPRVTVGRMASRQDVLAGRLSILISMPEAFEGDEFLLGLDGERFHTRATNGIRSVVQNGRLRFDLPFLRPGLYRVGLSGARFRVWLPGVRRAEEGDTVGVGTASPARYEGTLAPPAWIRGRIPGSRREAGEWAQILSFDADSLRLDYANLTRDDPYELVSFPAEPIRLQVDITNVTRWIGGDSFASATVFEPSAGETLTVSDYIESGLRCRLEGPGPLLVHDGRMRVRDEAGREWRTWAGSQDPVICNLTAGRYWVQVEHDGTEIWAPRWYGGAESFAGATPVEVRGDGELMRLTITLERGGRIAGRLLRDDGEPARMDVTLRTTSTESLIDAVSHAHRPEAAGGFDFSGLPDRDYRLEVRLQEGRLWWYPGTADSSLADVIAIRGHQTVDLSEWRLPSVARPAGSGGRPPSAEAGR